MKHLKNRNLIYLVEVLVFNNAVNIMFFSFIYWWENIIQPFESTSTCNCWICIYLNGRNYSFCRLGYKRVSNCANSSGVSSNNSFDFFNIALTKQENKKPLNEWLFVFLVLSLSHEFGSPESNSHSNFFVIFDQPRLGHTEMLHSLLFL